MNKFKTTLFVFVLLISISCISAAETNDITSDVLNTTIDEVSVNDVNTNVVEKKQIIDSNLVSETTYEDSNEIISLNDAEELNKYIVEDSSNKNFYIVNNSIFRIEDTVSGGISEYDLTYEDNPNDYVNSVNVSLVDEVIGEESIISNPTASTTSTSSDNYYMSVSTPSKTLSGVQITISFVIKNNNVNVNTGRISVTMGTAWIGSPGVSNGVASMTYTIPSNKYGNYTITGTYLNSSATTSNVKISKTMEVLLPASTTTMTFSQIPIAGSILGITVKVVDSQNHNISGGRVSIYRGTAWIGSPSVSNGVARMNYTLPSNYYGNYTFVGTYINASNTTTTVKATKTAMVYQPATTITLTSPSISVTENKITISTTVKDSSNRLIKNGRVSISLGSVWIGSPVINNGVASMNYTIPNNFNNTHTLKATYINGNNVTTTVIASKSIKIYRKVSQINLNFNESVMSGKTVTITVSVTGKDNCVIQNQGRVSLYFNGNWIGSPGPNMTGIASMTYTINGEYYGNYTINATYIYCDELESNVKQSKLISIYLPATQTTLNTVDYAITGNEITISVSVRDKNNHMLPNGRVSITFLGSSWIGSPAINNGVASMTYTIPDNYYGNYSMIATYINEYNTTTDVKASKTIEINLVTSNITIYASNGVINGTSTQIKVKVTDRIGHVTRRGTLSLKFGNSDIGTFTVNDGWVITNYNVPSTYYGNYVITASYMNTSNSVIKTASTNILVHTEAKRMQINAPLTAFQNNNVQINISVFDTKNNKINDGRVSLYVDDSWIASPGSDFNGKIEYTYNVAENHGSIIITGMYIDENDDLTNISQQKEIMVFYQNETVIYASAEGTGSGNNENEPASFDLALYTVHNDNIIYIVPTESNECSCKLDIQQQYVPNAIRFSITSTKLNPFTLKPNNTKILLVYSNFNVTVSNLIFEGENTQLIYNEGSLTLKNILIKNSVAKDNGTIILNNGYLRIEDSVFRNISTSYGVIFNNNTLYSTNNKYLNNLGYFGGVFYNNCSNITSQSDFMFNNTVEESGGTLFNKGSFYMEDGVLINNSAGLGGALYNEETLIIKNSLIENNTAHYNSLLNKNQTSSGGAIFGYDGRIFLMNTTLRENVARIGGAIRTMHNAYLYIVDSQLYENHAYFGGIITSYNTTLVLLNNKIINNQAEYKGIFYIMNSLFYEVNDTVSDNFGNISGGFIYASDAMVSINDSRLINNTACYGGSIYSLDSYIRLTNNSFINNYATVNGGALSSLNYRTDIFNCSFNNNNAMIGGAVYIEEGDLLINQSTFTNNNANSGGALTILGSETTVISNSTFIKNKATVNEGGSIYISNANVYVDSSNFTNNTAQKRGGAISTHLSNTTSVESSIFENNNAYNRTTTVYSQQGVLFLIDNEIYSDNTKNVVLLNNSEGYIDNNYWGTNNLDFNLITDNITPNSWKIIENDEFKTVTSTNNINLDLVTGYKELKMTNNNSNSVTTYQSDVLEFKTENKQVTPGSTVTITAYFNKKVTGSVMILSYMGVDSKLLIDSQNITYVYTASNNLGVEKVSFVLICDEYPEVSTVSNIFVTNNLNYFNLNDYDYITSIKNQGESGSCWAYSSIASLESSILLKYGIYTDFSENNLKNIINKYSSIGMNVKANFGSSMLRPISYMVSWYAPINEADDPYYDQSTTSTLQTSDFHVQDVLFIAPIENNNLNPIKEAIMQYGAIFTDIYIHETYEDISKINYYTNTPEYSNHAITLVGWDDNYSLNNFDITPPGNGAFIIKNSWGTEIGDNGYNYISYYDKTLGTYGFYAFILDNDMNYSTIYQHEIVSVSVLNFNTNDVWIANNYKAINNEYIQAVGTFFNQSSDYSVEIFKNGIQQYTQEGHVDYAGYKTITLNQYVSLSENDNFTAIIKITPLNSYGVEVFVQDSLKLATTTYCNDSFISTDGINWINLGKYQLVACLKVYTGNINSINENNNITNKQLTINIPNNGPTELPQMVLDNYNTDTILPTYTIALPLTRNIYINGLTFNTSFNRIISIENYNFNSYDLQLHTYFVSENIFTQCSQDYEPTEQGFLIYADENQIFIKYFCGFAEDINQFSIKYTTFDNDIDFDETNYKIESVTFSINNNNVTNVRFTEPINYNTNEIRMYLSNLYGLSYEDSLSYSIEELFYNNFGINMLLIDENNTLEFDGNGICNMLISDKINLSFEYNHYITSKIENINYAVFNSDYELLQTFVLSKAIIGEEDYCNWLNKSGLYENNIYKSFMIGLNVLYLNDFYSTMVSNNLSTTWTRSNFAVVLCGENKDGVYIDCLDPNMAMMVNGDSNTTIAFRLATSFMLSYWEQGAFNMVKIDAKSSLNKIIKALEDNTYTIFENGNLIYITANDDSNTTLVINTETGLVIDYFQDGENIFHGTSSNHKNLFGCEVGSNWAETERFAGSILMSAAPYMIGIPAVGPLLVPTTYIVGAALCADGNGLFNQNQWNTEHFVDFAFDIVTSTPFTEFSNIASKMPKIAKMLGKCGDIVAEYGNYIKSGATLVDNIFSGNSIISSIEKFGVTSLGGNIFKIKNVLEGGIKNICKGFKIPEYKETIKSVSDNFDKIFNFGEKGYDDFCNVLKQEKSNAMGFLYATLGTTKVTAEKLYGKFSRMVTNKILDNVCDSVNNGIGTILNVSVSSIDEWINNIALRVETKLSLLNSLLNGITFDSSQSDITDTKNGYALYCLSYVSTSILIEYQKDTTMFERAGNGLFVNNKEYAYVAIDSI